MPGSYQVHVTIPYFTGLPEDVITNVWSFAYTGGTPSTTQFNNLRDALDTFYTNVYSTGATDIAAPWVDWANASVKAYLLSDPTPRPPKYMSAMPITVTPGASSDVPPELAICLSFQGDPVAGVNQARRRGRLFLGGFGLWADPGDATQFPEVDSTIITAITTAADAFGNAVPAQQFFWSVWSRTTSTMVPITNGWVDNAPDTQRRRGADATSRTTFTI